MPFRLGLPSAVRGTMNAGAWAADGLIEGEKTAPAVIAAIAISPPLSRFCIGGQTPLDPARLLLGFLSRSAGARRPHEQFFPVGERDVATVRLMCSVLRLKTLDENHCSGRQRLLRKTSPEERVRGAAFDHP